MTNSSPITTGSSAKSGYREKRETSTGPLTRVEIFLKVLANASTRCLLSEVRVSPKKWRRRRERSVGTRFRDLPQLRVSPIKDVRVVHTMGSVQEADATSM